MEIFVKKIEYKEEFPFDDKGVPTEQLYTYAHVCIKIGETPFVGVVKLSNFVDRRDVIEHLIENLKSDIEYQN